MKDATNSSTLDDLASMQAAELRKQVALCADGSAFYRELWRAKGVDPLAIRSLHDMQRLPLTGKKDFIGNPEAFRLHCPDLPLQERALWEVNYTTGTSGNPSPVYMTTHDYLANMLVARRIAEIVGIRDTDVFANLFPVTPAPMGSFSRSAPYAYAAGVTVGAALPGARFSDLQVKKSLDDAVHLVERHKSTVLWGVTSFVRRVIIRAAELGADFTRVRLCAITGEASSPAMREDIRGRLRALGASAVIFDRYGTTEAGAFAQCTEEGDWHNPAPELLHLEIVDPDSGRRLPDGERGALAMTHLNRRGTVLLRYLAGDVASLAHGACPHCGRIGQSIKGPIVRQSDIVKIRGMLVDSDILFDLLRGERDVEEYQVVLRRQDAGDPFSMDELVLRVSSATNDRAGLCERLAARTHEAVHVRPVVDVVEHARSIYDPEAESKPRRLVDLRK
jgi:phenylacetate-CoA ligase